ncbi:GmrSD restriction endonuclease domain-containing protein [Schinkia sp. CFF1]
MSAKQDLAIRGENIQRIYNYYLNNKFTVNRRYQRKLVWTIEEKQDFIDSIIKWYPVPLVLLAESKEIEEDYSYEIIDGMQRLNAICSFIEGEFDISGQYFDLDTLADTKLLLDKGKLLQKTPKIDRKICSRIAGYVMPLSVYRLENQKQTDEIFRRINSNGKHLSKQELRQAGSIGYFPELVRTLSHKIRGDVTLSDKLLLNDMKLISITNKELEYGINVDSIFWVDHSILRRENVRESKDEEIVADLLAYMALPDKPGSSSQVLDEFYGFKGLENRRYSELETAIQKISPEVLSSQFIKVYDNLRSILRLCDKKFNQLIFSDTKLDKIPRYFQIVFLALYELIICENMKISNMNMLIVLLNGVADKHIKLSSGGGNWSAIERENNVKALAGILRKAFSKDVEDPAVNTWSAEFETILMQANTEQASFDFKLGFHSHKTGDFSDKTFDKVIKTLTAMANSGPKSVGYVLVGVTDNQSDAKSVNKLYNIEPTQFHRYYITGINGEVEKYHENLDRYFQKLVQKVKQQPMDPEYRDQIARNVRLIKYFDKDVLIFKINSLDSPAMYADGYYQRIGANVDPIPPQNYKDLFSRFYK